MSRTPLAFPLSSIALLVTLSACGGGGDGDASRTDDTAGASPDLGTASGRRPGAPVGESSTLSGRVADGYLRGATVCVDLDEDGACSADEPSALSGTGGSWTIELPPGAEIKPFVAEVPATAIDEDTGQAIGRSLALSAPAGRTAFLSPITTLVHEELRAHPALDIDAAERLVKVSLGLDAEPDVSLFADYVARGRDRGNASPVAERFRYLHDTARVVANLMQDVEAEVGRAAIARGHDVSSGTSAGRAVREIVREEVRGRLPDIAREVAVARERGKGADVGRGGADNAQRLDPAAIAEGLRPEGLGDDVDERIESIRDRPSPVAAELRSRLAAGAHWLDVDCRHDLDAAANTGRDAERTSGTRAAAAPSARCRAFHGVARLDEAGELRVRGVVYDPASGQWIEERPDAGTQPPVTELALLDGEWVAHHDGLPEGPVRFTDDGTAIVAGAAGDTVLYGATWSIAGRPLVAHLGGQANRLLADTSGRESRRFPDGAKALRLKVFEAVPTHVLRRDVDGRDCGAFGGDCNVVHALRGDLCVPLGSIDEVRARIGEGALDVLDRSRRLDGGTVAVMRLEPDASDEAGLPESGTVRWTRLSVTADPDGDADTDAGGAAHRGSGTGADTDRGAGATPGKGASVNAPDRRMFADEPLPEGAIRDSRWQLIEVDGVTMIEIDLPAALRHDDDDADDADADGDDEGLDEDDEAATAVLLVEHDGFVRRGARRPAHRVSSLVAYEERVFETLRTAIEIRLAGGAAER